MRKLLYLAVAGLIVTAPLRSAAAAMVGDASVSFRAERTVTVDGRSYRGPLFHAPGRERHEQDLMGMREIFLLDTRRAEGDLVLPSLRTYVAFPFPPMMADLASPDLLKAPVGQEEIAGIPTTKYRVDHRVEDGSRATGFLWLSRANILMKFDIAIARAHGGRPLLIAMALSDVRLGPQDPGLFVLPANFTQLPSGALAPLLGGSDAEKGAGHP